MFYLLCYVLCQWDLPLLYEVLPEWAQVSDQDVESDPDADYVRKWNTVIDDEDFEGILRRFNPDHQNLENLTRRLRNLVFPRDLSLSERRSILRNHGKIPIERLPIKNRRPKEYFAEYRRILVEAYESLHDRPRQELDDKNDGRHDSESSPLVRSPSARRTLGTVTNLNSPAPRQKRSRQLDASDTVSRRKRCRRETLR